LEIRTRHDLLPPGSVALASELLQGRNQALLCAEGSVISDLLAVLAPSEPGVTPDDQVPASIWTVEQGPEGLRVQQHPAVVPTSVGEVGWRRPRRSGVVVGGGGRL
ncbi:MAG: hypothetical protein OEW29_15175, partial [Acidimicrobiia bacterium]|nr:hypothetical protein [Acidimicrobiia bacterium]